MHFLEASYNLLDALRLLGKDPTNFNQADAPLFSTTNHTIEYEKH